MSDEIKSNIRAEHVSDSTIIGVQVQHGLDEEAVQRLVAEEVQRANADLSQWLRENFFRRLHEEPEHVPLGPGEPSPESAVTSPTDAEGAQLAHPLPLASSLFLCRSAWLTSLGFAVDNSGLVVCAAAIGPVVSVENVATREKHDVTATRQGSLLQAIRFAGASVGVVPAYLTVGSDEDHALWGYLDRPLFAFDASGGRQTLHVTGIGWVIRAKKFRPPTSDSEDPLPPDEAVFDGMIRCERQGDESLIGGPVFTPNSEVCGIVLVESQPRGTVFFAPWSNVDLEDLITARLLSK